MHSKPFAFANSSHRWRMRMSRSRWKESVKETVTKMFSLRSLLFHLFNCFLSPLLLHQQPFSLSVFKKHKLQIWKFQLKMVPSALTWGFFFGATTELFLNPQSLLMIFIKTRACWLDLVQTMSWNPSMTCRLSRI